MFAGILRPLTAEQIRQRLDVDADAGIMHRELGHPILGRPQTYFDGALLRSEMNRAVEEPDKRLTKPRAVGEQRTWQCFELEVELDAFRRAFLRGVRGRVDELFRVDGRELQSQIAR